MIKPGRITKSGYLPFLLLFLFCLISGIEIYKGEKGSDLPVFNAGIKPASWEAAKTYYKILNFLGKAGFLRCDGYRGLEKCNEKNKFVILERKIAFKNDLPVQKPKAPYNEMKVLVVNVAGNSEGPVVQSLFTGNSGADELRKIILLLSKSRTCKATWISRWELLETDKINDYPDAAMVATKVREVKIIYPKGAPQRTSLIDYERKLTRFLMQEGNFFQEGWENPLCL